MSAMKAIATGLEADWRPFLHCGYQRVLPSGQNAVINTWSCADRHGYSLTVNFERQNFDTLPQAIAAAGQIARAQLEQEARTWT